MTVVLALGCREKHQVLSTVVGDRYAAFQAEIVAAGDDLLVRPAAPLEGVEWVFTGLTSEPRRQVGQGHVRAVDEAARGRLAEQLGSLGFTIPPRVPSARERIFEPLEFRWKLASAPSGNPVVEVRPRLPGLGNLSDSIDVVALVHVNRLSHELAFRLESEAVKGDSANAAVARQLRSQALDGRPVASPFQLGLQVPNGFGWNDENGGKVPFDALGLMAQALRDGTPGSVVAGKDPSLSDASPWIPKAREVETPWRCTDERALDRVFWSPQDLICQSLSGPIQWVRGPTFDLRQVVTLGSSKRNEGQRDLVEAALAPSTRKLLIATARVTVPSRAGELSRQDRGRKLELLDLATGKVEWSAWVRSQRFGGLAWSSDEREFLALGPSDAGTHFHVFDAAHRPLAERSFRQPRAAWSPTRTIGRAGGWDLVGPDRAPVAEPTAQVELRHAPADDDQLHDRLPEYRLEPRRLRTWRPGGELIDGGTESWSAGGCRLEFDSARARFLVDGAPLPGLRRPQLTSLYEQVEAYDDVLWVGPCHVALRDGARGVVLNLATGSWRYLFAADDQSTVVAVRSDFRQALVSSAFRWAAIVDLPPPP